MTEITVDEKHRILLNKELRKPLGITAGTILEAEYKGGTIVLTPKVPVKKPTEALWGIAAGVIEKSPKKIAREAISKRKTGKMKH